MRINLKTVFALGAYLSPMVGFSQTPAIHPELLGLHFNENAFNSSKLFNGQPTYDAGVSINYLKGFRPHWDYNVQLSGSFPKSISARSRSAAGVSSSRTFFLQSEFSIRSRLFVPGKKWQPFAQTGIGTGVYGTRVPLYGMIGPGLEVDCHWFYILLNAQYRPAFNNLISCHFFYSAGVAGIISKKKRTRQTGNGVTAPAIAVVVDRDSDGIPDDRDECPGVPGLARFLGCPDTDDDGIEDRKDSCVSVPGVASLNGCPVKSIPISDSINLMAKNILFETGSDVLLTSSKPVLDTIGRMLSKNPALNIIIEGHTDNQGSLQSNQKLSERRAQAVKDYLIATGVTPNRLSTVGFGETAPIADNNTSEGRALNRRVVFVIK